MAFSITDAEGATILDIQEGIIYYLPNGQPDPGQGSEYRWKAEAVINFNKQTMYQPTMYKMLKGDSFVMMRKQGDVAGKPNREWVLLHHRRLTDTVTTYNITEADGGKGLTLTSWQLTVSVAGILTD